MICIMIAMLMYECLWSVWKWKRGLKRWPPLPPAVLCIVNVHENPDRTYKNVSNRSIRSQIFFKIDILVNFSYFLFLRIVLIKKKLQQKCFPLKFAKFYKSVVFYRTLPVAPSDRNWQRIKKDSSEFWC